MKRQHLKWSAVRASLLAGCLLLFATPLLAQKDFYKWTDASGTTHYSETPPPKKQGSVVRISEGRPELQDSSRPAPATSTVSAEALRLANEDYQKRACLAAKADVAAVRSGAMLVDGKDPQRSRALNTEERAKAEAAAQSRVSQFCAAEKGS